MRVKENLLTESIPFPKKELFLHVICVEYLDKYQLKLTFNNGIEGIVDLEKELYGEIFEPLKDQSLFQKVYVNSRTIEWPNGADFAPEFLFEIALDKQPVSMVGDRVGCVNEM
ncbi:DUF2442 domain-containing protein [Microcystis aeruginosa]|uniref:DUF2442 domain-containing protein n=2 Tax=Microcystis TaxID=1125 RepID=A0A552I0L0_MICVR|nr:DUF2442 domain-containing protein [Microcystis aeruginosa]TRU76201.1 MAG: DUF2442 domain-containing protein [Microcystis viridis Mv_BB_P_19951000_S69]TRU76412.1 MAG: DUF2442 domain-containing protein [Microcystis viridis Mv_BB_P_19951000_S68]TRU76908.1 MAG: DUF2442 domain-containing protein [Microcystis viridis Mv_BB_P_19951000_S68D]TRU86548.1 MAG: DUF2442 domain-containing protein [Microcystis viridis Mv_BB_P_19951000_S69D]QGZ89666.1 DUF2442 domain-containing protein [Microcystis aeruginos